MEEIDPLYSLNQCYLLQPKTGNAAACNNTSLSAKATDEVPVGHSVAG